MTVNILLFVSIMFVIALAVVAWTSYSTIADEATKATKNRLYAMIREIEIPLVEVEVSTLAGARIVQAVPGDDDLLIRLAHSAVAQSDKVVGCAVAFADGVHRGDHWFAPYTYRDPATGEVVDKYLGSSTYDYHRMQWFQGPYETGNPQWSDPYFDTDGGNQLMTTYSYPVKDADGKVFAIITADIAIDWIDSLLHTIRPYPNSVASILCQDETVIGIDDPALLEMIREQGGKNEQLQRLHNEMKKGGDSLIRFRTGRHWSYAVYAPLRMGWSATIVCQYSDVLRSANRMLLQLIVMGLVGLLIVSLVCWLTLRQLTKPVDRMEGELTVARDIQLGMLRTDFPTCLHALLEPAKEVGGDLYDFNWRPDGGLYFAVGDVSGKGAPAALMMAITRAALRFVAGLGLSLGEAVGRVNNSVVDANSGGMFVTLFVGRLDPKTGLLRYCNGGHNPILVVPPDGEPYLLKAKANLALGVFADFQYEAEEMQLKPGTRLVLYTDGVTEAERDDHAQYGEERLLAWASTALVRDPKSTEQEVVESLFASVKEFVEGNMQNDDITIMSVLYEEKV
ncbi:MAG: SpoIIE family protein phosphatase [Bacteroidales bacterium]|nr:SpoIIE family protein phosphatase [Bacteroidales bacterium]